MNTSPRPWTFTEAPCYITFHDAEGTFLFEIVTHDAHGPIADPATDLANARLILASVNGA